MDTDTRDLRNPTHSPAGSRAFQLQHPCSSVSIRAFFNSSAARRFNPGLVSKSRRRSKSLAQLRHEPRFPAAGRLVLPEAQDPPAGGAQRAVHPPVPRLVRGQFPPPERGVVARLRGVQRTSVPKTPVHKHRQPQLREYEIRADAEDAGAWRRLGRAPQSCTWNLRMAAVCRPTAPPLPAPLDLPAFHFELSPPTGKPVRPEQLRQRQFRGPVAARADARHHLRPL